MRTLLTVTILEDSLDVDAKRVADLYSRVRLAARPLCDEGGVTAGLLYDAVSKECDKDKTTGFYPTVSVCSLERSENEMFYLANVELEI